MKRGACSKTIIVILALLIATASAAAVLLTQSIETPKSASKPDHFTVKTNHKENGIYVYWNSVDGAQDYCVYRNYLSDGKRTLLSKTSELFFTDEKINTGEKAQYIVVAEHKGKEIISSKSKEEVLYRVCIETGHGIDEHGKWDTGCHWNGIEEAKLMIPIARSMAEHLEQNGVVVHTDAFTDNDSNLFAMLDYLDEYNVSAFVNIHCDYENAESGTLPLYNTDAQKKLAECLNKGVHSEIIIPDRGLEYRDDLDTLCSEKVHCPSCLFETGSIKADFTILSEQYDAYGKGLAKGLCDYLGVEFKTESQNN